MWFPSNILIVKNEFFSYIIITKSNYHHMYSCTPLCLITPLKCSMSKMNHTSISTEEFVPQNPYLLSLHDGISTNISSPSLWQLNFFNFIYFFHVLCRSDIPCGYIIQDACPIYTCKD